LTETKPSAARRGATGAIADFIGYIVAYAGRQTALAILFLVVAGFTDGVSVLLLVPILKLLDPVRSSGVVHIPTGPAARWLGPALSVELPIALLAFVGIIALRSALMRYKDLLTTGLIQDFVNRLRNDVFKSVAHARWAFLARLRGSDINHALTADIDRVTVAVFQVLQLAQTAVLVAIYGTVALLISPKMALFAGVVAAVALAVMAPIRRLALRYGATLTDQRQEQYRIVSEFLAGLKLAKSATTESIYVEQLASTLGAMRQSTMRFMRIYTLGGAFFQIITAGGLALFVYVAVIRYRMAYSSIIALVFLFVRLAPRVTAIHGTVQELLTNIPAFNAMLRLKQDCEQESEPPSDPSTPIPVAYEAVAFVDVDFAYAEEASRPILRKASFSIPVDRITAIIGPSGSGKSTIADLIMGLLEPTSGVLTIDGAALRDEQRRGWRSQLAYVPQDAFLLHDTIATNLSFGRGNLDETAMWKALRDANADGFVRALPQGLATIVGDRGVRLSGGERQRIALARALLRNPRLLLLDEATSALDWQSQALIASAIQGLRGRTTVVTIAHRPSMIAFADWVVAIEDGCVVEVGPYAQLSEKKGSHLQRLLAGDRTRSLDH
jgi:ATP-binding cassette subfamily C protein